jgi:hypothetical protein
MSASALRAEHTIVRRAFEAWSVEIPATFAETYVHEDSYWHAWDDHRSVSLTSVVFTDKHGPVSAERILRELPPMDGDPFMELPPGHAGQAVTGRTVEPARASRFLSGMLAADGRVLLATVTSDDLEWARQVWLSIRGHPASLPSRRERRAANRKRRRGR